MWANVQAIDVKFSRDLKHQRHSVYAFSSCMRDGHKTKLEAEIFTSQDETERLASLAETRWLNFESRHINKRFLPHPVTVKYPLISPDLYTETQIVTKM